MPTATNRPRGLRVQASRRRWIEARRRWASGVQWPRTPAHGWLNEVRVASGLSSRDVAVRLGVNQSAVMRAEASERKGTVQIDVLRRYADAMDADLHYLIVPRGSVLWPADSVGRPRRHHLRLRRSRRPWPSPTSAPAAAPRPPPSPP